MEVVLGARPRKESTLVVLDRTAAHVIEARALFMTLPSDERDELRVLCDALLVAIGRRIAAELPPEVLASGS